jgi:hypothetical protein
MRDTPIRLAASHFFWIVLATTLAVLAVACILPDDHYLRYQALTEREVVKAGWIYERIHYDPAPIDVAFIGTSHTVFGVDSERVERACHNAGGKRCASVNFGLQHLGRNVHWLLAREVMQTRKPRLLVVEVQETEYRALHPAFASLADASDIVSAPLVINTSYLPDLVRLPLRQISLFAQGRVPSLFGMHREFRRALYRGAHWDDTLAEMGSREHPVTHPRPRTGVTSVAELERERAHAQSADNARLRLPAPLRPLEYRANIFYLEKLLNLAREKNVEIRFLYMPGYHGAPVPALASFYDRFAPTWPMPREIADRSELWLDAGHLNSAGADALSAWLGAKIAKDEPGATSDGVAAHS